MPERFSSPRLSPIEILNLRLEQTVQQTLDTIFGIGLCSRFSALDKTIEILTPNGEVLFKQEADPDFFTHSGRLQRAIKKRLRVVIRRHSMPLQDPVILGETLEFIHTTSPLKFSFKRTEEGFILIDLAVPPLQKRHLLEARKHGIELENLGPQTKRILLFLSKGPNPHPQDLEFSRIILPQSSSTSIQRLLEEEVAYAQKNGR